ncbi:MAG: TPMT family class I SAM-dependent methyltransferase, partial [Candidatus Kapabacteria bacterium]|nr:TPMT family class I SAM-dependent methyltransferase [Candidatus Kapabacteria bacterium]MDW7996478.1 hypothetical protein [Bacteroidota bacterium]
VIAVDFAPEPLQVLQARLAHTSLPVQLLCVDLFHLPEHCVQPVDAVVEYTCYCAIAPWRRCDYFSVMSRLLSPGGWFVGLFFPVTPEPSLVGPPFPVCREEVLELGQRHGLVLRRHEVPQCSHPARRGREELMMFQKGKG